MNGPRLAAIVHGARWPLGDAGAQWRDRLARALHREVEIVLARDEVASPRGAASTSRGSSVPGPALDVSAFPPK